MVFRIIPFGLIWLFSGWLFLAIEFTAVEQTDEWASTAIRMDLQIFVVASLAITIVGLILGFFEVRYVDKLFARQSFSRRLLYKVIFYAACFSLIILIMYPLAASLELHTGFFDKRVWDKYTDFLSSKTHISTMLQMSASQFLALFYSEISESMGPRVLMNFFTGKYHQPVEEERVFMFLDMRASTTIAEQLGHKAYFSLLRAFYADLSPAIIDHAGEIYQYAGDEVIISWPLGTGTNRANCVKAFFTMRSGLARRKTWYLRRFGVFPEFKAGLHCGLVTTGEIGVVKKEIFFTSDVLNATSRIQGLCNNYNVDILISADLIAKIPLPEAWHAISLGVTNLRGKTEDMELFTVTEA